MTLSTVAIVAVAAILVTLFTHLGVELSHDTRPRDPYNQPPPPR